MAASIRDDTTRAGHHAVRPRRRDRAATGCNRPAANRFRRRTACASRVGSECRRRTGRRRDPARWRRRRRRRRPAPAARRWRRAPRGWGNGTVGKSGSGANWLATVCTSVKPAARSACQCELAADPVHRRQRHPRRGAWPSRTAAARVDVVPDHLGVGGCTGARAISSAGGAAAIAALDLAVGGGDDLHSAVEVHLVAVVGRRVVRRGDLHARPPRRRAARRTPRTGVGSGSGSSTTEKPCGGKHFRGRQRRTRRSGAGRRGRRRRSAPPRPRSLSTLATAQLALRTTVDVHPVRAVAHGSAQGRRCRTSAAAVMTVIDAQMSCRSSETRDLPASASLRRTGATSISRSNSSSGEVVAHRACSQASRSARSASSSGGARGGELDELSAAVGGVGAARDQAAGYQFVDAVGQRLHPHVQACGEFGGGGHPGAADLAEHLHLAEGQPVVAGGAGASAGSAPSSIPAVRWPICGAVDHYQVIPWQLV